MWEKEVLEKIGEEGIASLIGQFYAQIPDDPILGPMYPADDLEGAETRLTDFVIFRLGGSQAYVDRRGHPRLRQRHMPFQIDQGARDRWVSLMDNAFERCELPEEARAPLKAFFAEVAAFLMNR